MKKTNSKRFYKDGNYNLGRWQVDEHKRFIEAILKYGNDWKLVQKHVYSRSSTQARSHAQKFFSKIKNSKLKNNLFNFDLSNGSIKSLHEKASEMSVDEYFNAVKLLNCVTFERTNGMVKKNKKGKNTDSTESESVFEEFQNMLILK